MLKSTRIKLHAAATLFASRDGCSAQDISDILKIPRNSVYHLAKMPEWHLALDALHYEGERKFKTKRTRDPQRDSGELVAQAHALYITERRDGQKHSRAVNTVLEALNIKDRKTLNAWAKRYNWEADIS